MNIPAALRLGRTLLAHHRLDDWSLDLDQARTRAGLCDFRRRRITISVHLTRMHEEAEVRDTLLHEIAHALVGPGHAHDDVWRATATRIGGTGATYVPADAANTLAPWHGTCPVGHITYRHRRPRRVASCSQCGRTFDLTHLLTWTYRGRRGTMSAAYLEELAELRSRSVPAGAARPELPLGATARIVAPGRHLGATGIVEGRGRTRYQIRVASGLLTVPFHLAEPAAPMGESA